MEQEKKLIRLNPQDNVAVALSELKSGEGHSLDEASLTLQNDIPFGHKVALNDIVKGENIVKYGSPIGHALHDIRQGEHIHTHNLKTNLGGLLEYQYNPKPASPRSVGEPPLFQGYRRPDGKVGIRNEVWILPLVGCVNNTAQRLERMAAERFGGRCDGVFSYVHNMGCSQMGEDQETTQKLLAGIARNPNAGGVLLLGLGCENNHMEVFKPFLGDYDPQRIRFLVTQDVEDEYEAGLRVLDELTAYAATFRREPVPVSELTVGFKCGGSDAFSGITANALCGRVNDRLTAWGAGTMLTEVPEMFGAETLLMERAVSRDVFERTVGLINGYKEYFMKYDQTIYENPSPGNKKGGISTLEEKSLGCVQKGGQAPVVGVLGYGEALENRGLNLLVGSGNDQVSCTNMVASGATMILFTTGRGNPFGSPVPTLKLASNTPLYRRKEHWIDFNAGIILEGESFDSATDALLNKMLAIASGNQLAKNESEGYRDISIFRDGVIL